MKSRTRSAFTLVELMVAMALTMFVMVILSQAFVLALETFSGMTGVGTMVQNLRVAEVLLRDDFSQDHFEGQRRLSDLNAVAYPQIAVAPPQAGFFAVRQGSTVSAVANSPYLFEGSDANGLPSYRAVDHFLYFTVKRKGNRQENFFTTSLPELAGLPPMLGQFFSKRTTDRDPITELPYDTLTQPYYAGQSPAFYSSQWAEVVYYLVRTGGTEEGNNPLSAIGTPLYALYRAVFVMTPDSTNVNTAYGPPTHNAAAINALALNTFAGMSCNPGATNLQFYSPGDAALLQRVMPDPTATTPGANGRVHHVASATLVLPNVVSFHVQIIPIAAEPWNSALSYATNDIVNYNGFTYTCLQANNNTLPTNTTYWAYANYFMDVPRPFTGATSGHYDTAWLNPNYANYGSLRNKAGLRAIQVTLRVWDSKTRQTRQASIVQDL